MNKKSYTIIEFYKAYNEEYPDTIDYKTYRAIMLDLFKSMAEGLLYRSEEYKLPYNLGKIRIGKKKPKTYTSKSLAVDYKTSNELGYKVYHLNEHSDGFKYRFYWSKIGLRTRIPRLYRVEMIRKNKRDLAHIIKNKITDFPEIK